MTSHYTPSDDGDSIVPRHGGAAQSVAVTQTSKLQLTKTFSDTTRVKVRCVTTTSRLGGNKVVTKSTNTTTTKTRRAKVRIEPLEEDDTGAQPAKPLNFRDIDGGRILEDFVKTLPAGGEENGQETQTEVFVDDFLQITPDQNTVLLSPFVSKVKHDGDDDVKPSLESTVDCEIAPGSEGNGTPLLRDPADVITAIADGGSFLSPDAGVIERSLSRKSIPQHIGFPEGRSYKELYFDAVFH